MVFRRRRAKNSRVELAPLWLPKHGSIVVEHASASPPMALDGYSLRSRVVASLIGSPLETAAGFATLLAAGIFLATLPSLAGVASLLTLATWQIWSIGLTMLITVRVRSISVGAVIRYWLVGMLSVAILAYFAGKPLLGFEESEVWVIPILEEVLKALPLVFAVVWGRRTWRHPGLVDMIILGFAVGGGYAFHAAGLWGASWTAGLGLDLGLLVPTMAEVDGRLIAGQALWSGLVGLAIGLVALYRHRPLALVAAAFLIVVVLADHMSVADTGALEPVRAILFDGVAVVVLGVLALGVASAMDVKRLVWTGRRDHLFPSDLAPNALDVESEPSVFEAMLVGRYRRLRIAMHTTVHSVAQQWPPLSESKPAPLAELAHRARAAGVNIGPGSSATGWASDPERPGGSRFVGINGFTVYAVRDARAPHAAAEGVEALSEAKFNRVRVDAERMLPGGEDARAAAGNVALLERIDPEIGEGTPGERASGDEAPEDGASRGFGDESPADSGTGRDVGPDPVSGRSETEFAEGLFADLVARGWSEDDEGDDGTDGHDAMSSVGAGMEAGTVDQSHDSHGPQAADTADEPTGNPAAATDPDTPEIEPNVRPAAALTETVEDEVEPPETDIDTAAESSDPEVTDSESAVEPESGDFGSGEPTVILEPTGTSDAWMSVPAARPTATGSSVLARPDRFWQIAAAGGIGMGALVGARLFTAGDPAPALADLSMNLAGAPATPMVITGIVGAIAAAVALIGPASDDPVPVWELGPGDDPVPHRPSECEV